MATASGSPHVPERLHLPGEDARLHAADGAARLRHVVEAVETFLVISLLLMLVLSVVMVLTL